MHPIKETKKNSETSRKSLAENLQLTVQIKSVNLKAIDLECKLSDLGIAEEDIPWMAENCMKVSAAGVANNPVVFTQEEIAEIYRKAL